MKSASDITCDFVDELIKAHKKHPDFPKDIMHQIGIVNEEVGEATKACLNYLYEGQPKENIEKELIQTGAMCIRMLQHLSLKNNIYIQ